MSQVRLYAAWLFRLLQKKLSRNNIQHAVILQDEWDEIVKSRPENRFDWSILERFDVRDWLDDEERYVEEKKLRMEK